LKLISEPAPDLGETGIGCFRSGKCESHATPFQVLAGIFDRQRIRKQIESELVYILQIDHGRQWSQQIVQVESGIDCRQSRGFGSTRERSQVKAIVRKYED
jgi:hypothetical protein